MKGHTCCFVYFRCLNLLIQILCLKRNGFECQALVDDPKCVFYHLSAWRCCVSEFNECQWKSMLGAAALAHHCSPFCCVYFHFIHYSGWGRKLGHRFAHLFSLLIVWCRHLKVWINKHANVTHVNYRLILEREGPRSLFRGLGPNLVGVAPSRYSQSQQQCSLIDANVYHNQTACWLKHSLTEVVE